MEVKFFRCLGKTTLLLEKAIFRSVEMHFCRNFSFRMVEADLVSYGTVFPNLIFFLLVETVTEISRNPYLGNTLFSLVETVMETYFQWKLFSFIQFFFPASRNRF